MNSRPPRRSADDVPGQLQIDWTASTLPATVPAIEAPAREKPDPAPALVQRLKWDFRTTFPQPTQEALDAGVLTEEDTEPENLKSLHDEHAREALAALESIDKVLDARRRGVDPKTGRPPTTKETREGLSEFLQYELDRFQRWWQTLMDTHRDAFGPEAADAFGKAIRAWHAKIPVVLDRDPAAPLATQEPVTAPASPTTDARKPAALFPAESKRLRRTISTRLPVPKPLPAAVAAGHFGHDDHGPIRPGADEVRAITERHGEKLIELFDGLRQVETWLSSSQCSDQARLYRERDMLNGRVTSAIAAYAEDFGTQPAEQLEAYARRQARLQEAPSSTPGRHR